MDERLQDTDSSCSSEPSSSQSKSSGYEMPFFSLESLNFHVQPQTLSHGYESICQPYGQGCCHLKQKSLKCKMSIGKYWKDFKKPLDERRLVQAVSMNDEAVVHNLLNRGTNPNCHDNLSRTPLHMAACKGYTHIVKILLDRGADPNKRDLIGNTPLHLAACTNNIDVVLLLLKAGTDARSSDPLGRSPLQLAQSKLKILQRAKYPDCEMKKQVSMVIEMLLHFSKKSKKSSAVEALDLELLSTFQSQLKLTETRHDIDSQLCDLLDNLSSLAIDPA